MGRFAAPYTASHASRETLAWRRIRVRRPTFRSPSCRLGKVASGRLLGNQRHVQINAIKHRHRQTTAKPEDNSVLERSLQRLVVPLQRGAVPPHPPAAPESRCRNPHRQRSSTAHHGAAQPRATTPTFGDFHAVAWRSSTRFSLHEPSATPWQNPSPVCYDAPSTTALSRATYANP